LHNTSHGNIPNKLLNGIIGEWCGAWVSYGYTNFVMIHMLHHQFSDEELDPVNPKGMNFLLFLSAPMRYMIKTTKQYLFMVHQAVPHYAQIMQAQTAVFHMNLILRVSFWYLLLGQDLFVWFYLPTLLTFGGYFHKNHHQKLSSFNPSLMNNDIWEPTPGTGVAHYFSLNDIWGERRKERLTLSQLYPKAAQRLQAHMSDILR
jgi:fatty-acid desaturase